jgi:rubrerythrin
MAMTGKEFVKHIEEVIEPLLRASELQTAAYFRNQPDLDDAIFHFKRRMFNERMNVVEIAKTLAAMPASADPVQIKLLSKQVLDEAKHYDMVKNVIEYLSGEKLSDEEIEKEFAWQMSPENIKAKGASLFEEIGAEGDETLTAVYQMVAEGRAGRVWFSMANSIDDPVVKRTYSKIAKDETFHSKIGARTIEKVCHENEAEQAKVLEALPKMFERMYWINCMGHEALPETAKLMEDAYGIDLSEEKHLAKGKPWFQPKGELKNWVPTPRGAFDDTESNEVVDNFAQ